jgi:hypothetical protein
VRPNGTIDFAFMATSQICHFWDWLNGHVKKATWTRIRDEIDDQELAGRLLEIKEIYARVKREVL